MQRSQSIPDVSPDATHSVLFFTSPCVLPHTQTVDPVLRPFSSKKQNYGQSSSFFPTSDMRMKKKPLMYFK